MTGKLVLFISSGCPGERVSSHNVFTRIEKFWFVTSYVFFLFVYYDHEIRGLFYIYIKNLYKNIGNQLFEAENNDSLYFVVSDFHKLQYFNSS